MNGVSEEIGRTVRAAILAWPQTIRLIAIMTAATALIGSLLVMQ